MQTNAPLYDGTQDPQFQQPYVDIDEWRDQPVRHRYLHGGFEGTNTKFSFYYPPEEGYERRFFHFVSPVQGSENANQGNDGAIGFAVSSGAYFVESNMGGMSPDFTLVYRANAAVAQYSRVKAAELYGPHRPYGYVFGGSGGGYKTISCIESTKGVWDGAVPFVIGTPMAMPNVFSVRVHAMRILKEKFPSIIDALEPGGSGDMYAGLNEEERQALEEVTRMGFPPRSWFAYNEIGDGALSVLSPAVFQSDPSYFEDFWTVPGYLGAKLGSSAIRARVQFKTVVSEVIRADKDDDLSVDRSKLMGVDEAWKSLQDGTNSAPSFRLESVPNGELYMDGAYIVFTSGEAAGQKVPLGQINGNVVTVGSAFGFHESAPYLDRIKPGDEIMLDNSDYIALQTYHRHQVPTPDYYVWDQYRDEDGQPLYPQRPFLLGPAIAYGGAGSVQSGRFDGKMIVVEALMDESAFPWQADWYRTKVKEALGDKLDDHFRLWYIDHALHAESSSNNELDELHIVGYIGALHQALLDLSAWVEQGIIPPASTNYEVDNGQVIVPQGAAERQGIQPVVTVKANGGQRADVTVGEAVSFSGNIEIPPNTGRIVSAEWDFEGGATYPIDATFNRMNEDGSQVVVEVSYAFSKPGTYFPVLRAASNREGNSNDKYTQVLNLCRVRVVVT
ncbi:hypothetical protein [Candidatus Pristimantibacillus sp. PTI5]|uniref:hypothetical protein n=1 Tax=Candidatus Pristimantibacillus sp. PTI5 TaxID=3400422 RepID=UPI003B019A3C